MADIKTVSPIDAQAMAAVTQGQASVNRLENLGKTKTYTDAEVNKAATGFEALLLHQMLKSMWSTVDTTGLLGEDSNQGQLYRDMFHQAVADTVAEGQGIGVKEFLAKEIKRQVGGSEDR